ncbi:MAG TPA: agmatinase family protein [Phycisphaerales bacterium]|nr:agmatinase family protein [Phycisphaerales bacterium]
MHTFDPDAAARPGSGIFGLPHGPDEAGIVLIPVPFDATTSYGGGAAEGPEAIRAASSQVDLLDPQFGPVFQAGLHMEAAPAWLAALSARARALAQPIIERGGADPDSPEERVALAEVDAAGARVNEHVHARVSGLLARGKVPGLVGGDHSTPFGAIRACAEHVAARRAGGGMGLLHLDAHMDLREAYDGFTWSHASIMHNVITRVPGVGPIVQIGLRDVGGRELEFARQHADRLHTHFDIDWARALAAGRPWTELAHAALAPLPEHVYISFDIDALEPALCPGTGTPVPGGLSFNQACLILETLRASGRRVVGFDLVEVAPGPNPAAPSIDANAGARLLYKLCGVATGSR